MFKYVTLKMIEFYQILKNVPPLELLRSVKKIILIFQLQLNKQASEIMK